MIPLVIGNALAKHWRWFALAGAVIAVFIGFQIVQSKLSDANAKLDTAVTERAQAVARLDVSNASIKAMQSEIDQQNGAIEELGRDGERRLLEGRALILAEVRKGSAASVAAAKLIAAPKSGGDQAKSSDAVMAMRGDL